jgi:uncharacterized membrane protein YgdD (TMEM256/DUF423 family)
MGRIFFILGALFAFVSVAAGAFGAHSLRETMDPRYLTVFETAARYQMYHAFALMAAGWGLDRSGETYFRFAGWVFASGILLFSGSLYALSLTGQSVFGAITPFGGVLFLAGWILMVLGFRSMRTRTPINLP